MSKLLENQESRQYLPAMLKNNKSGWTIEYYALHPQTKLLQRRQIKLNRERKRFSRLSDFKLYANDIVCNINNRLLGGWSPFMEAENTRYYTKLSEVMELYLEEKKRELRPATFNSYRSFCNMLREWTDQNTPNIYMSLFNRLLAIRYLDYVYNKRKVSSKTYNNHLKMGSAFFSWAKDRCYIKENPFETIRTKRVEKKKRILIPKETRNRITEYFEERCPSYLVVCQLVFTALIRPKEIVNLRLRNVSIQGKTICVPADVAKNHHERYAAMTEQLLERLDALHLEKYPRDFYLIGAGFMPGKEPCSTKVLRTAWNKMRKELHLPDEMQLYSLRDTGINNLLKNGVDPLSVMQHADHHDLSMTTRYADHADPNLTRLIYEKAPDF